MAGSTGGRPRPVLLAVVLATVLIGVGVAGVSLADAPSRVGDWLFGFLIGAGFIVFGCIILIRAQWNRVGWLMVIFGAAISIGDSVAVLLPEPTSTWLVDNWVVATLYAVLAYLALVFPDGRLPSGRRMWSGLPRVAAVALVVAVVLPILEAPGSGLVPPGVSWGFSLALIVLVGGVISLVARYLRGAGEEKAQLGWILAAFGLIVITTVLTNVAVLGWGVDDDFYALAVVGFAAVPVAITVAITRYRLYDIDRLVSRTVSYTLVVGVLAGLFAAITVGFPQLLDLPDDEPLLIAGATLAVAALFNPLRLRIQKSVDRRFNRARFDAQREVDHLADRLRDEVQLDDVTSDLIDVAANTLQPESAAVWIKGGE